MSIESSAPATPAAHSNRLTSPTSAAPPADAFLQAAFRELSGEQQCLVEDFVVALARAARRNGTADIEEEDSDEAPVAQIDAASETAPDRPDQPTVDFRKMAVELDCAIPDLKQAIQRRIDGIQGVLTALLAVGEDADPDVAGERLHEMLGLIEIGQQYARDMNAAFCAFGEPTTSHRRAGVTP